jgi:hypothetical protein
MASFIRTPDHLTVVFSDGQVETVYPSNPNYDEIITALNNKDWDTVRRLADPADEIKRVLADNNVSEHVSIVGGIVYFDDNPMHNHLTDRMLSMLDEGIDIAPLALFLENLLQNPSYRAVNELYGFLESSNLPITEDGYFLAYKRIKSDWTDQYSGTIDHSIGSTPEMPRNEVDEDKNRTCSSGLHFCSREYLPHYGSSGGGRVVVVKINPRDVVSIPSDYNNAKGRCCRYEVINEIKLESSEFRSLPKATLEDTYRHSGGVSSGTTDRVLAQYNLDSGREIARFTTPSEAQRMTGIDSSSISKAARGVRNTAGGYGWKYIDVLPDTAQPPVNVRRAPFDDELPEHDYDDNWDGCYGNPW